MFLTNSKQRPFVKASCTLRGPCPSGKGHPDPSQGPPIIDVPRREALKVG
jgi:hypothetical protein